MALRSGFSKYLTFGFVVRKGKLKKKKRFRATLPPMAEMAAMPLKQWSVKQGGPNINVLIEVRSDAKRSQKQWLSDEEVNNMLRKSLVYRQPKDVKKAFSAWKIAYQASKYEKMFG